MARLRRASLAAELAARHPDRRAAGSTRAARAGGRGATVSAPSASGRRRWETRWTGCEERPRRPAGRSTELVTLDPPAAAERILTAMREWGYLDR